MSGLVERLKCERSKSTKPNLNGLIDCDCQKCQDARAVEALKAENEFLRIEATEKGEHAAALGQQVEALEAALRIANELIGRIAEDYNPDNFWQEDARETRELIEGLDHE
jgi:hypothetical protein